MRTQFTHPFCSLETLLPLTTTTPKVSTSPTLLKHHPLHLHRLHRALPYLHRLFSLLQRPLPKAGLSPHQVSAIWTFHRTSSTMYKLVMHWEKAPLHQMLPIMTHTTQRNTKCTICSGFRFRMRRITLCWSYFQGVVLSRLVEAYLQAAERLLPTGEVTTPALGEVCSCLFRKHSRWYVFPVCYFHR